MALKTTIQSLAEEFAQNVIAALRGASLAELTELGGSAPRATVGTRRARPAPAGTPREAAPTRVGSRIPRTRKGARRDAASMQRIVDVIIAAVAKRPDGLRSEDLQRELGVRKKDLVRPIQIALDRKTLRKTGIKRATRYFLAR